MVTATATPNSTTVRAKHSPKLATLRAAFAILDRTSPTLAARWAMNMWCTLPTNKGRRQDNRPYPGWLDTVWLPGNRRVVVETWGEGEPVYLVHGWGGWRGQLGAFVTPLVDAGHEVVAFDVPSHGQSSAGELGKGKGSGIEFAESLAAVAEVYGRPAGLIAHSFGVATSTLAIQDGLSVRRLAFVAPSPDPVSLTQQMADLLGYSEATHNKFLARLEYLARRPLADLNIDAKGAELDLPPTLVAHDRADKEVPYDLGARLAKSWPSAELATTDGLGHQRILRDSNVVQMVTDFISTR